MREGGGEEESSLCRRIKEKVLELNAERILAVVCMWARGGPLLSGQEGQRQEAIEPRQRCGFGLLFGPCAVPDATKQQLYLF